MTEDYNNTYWQLVEKYHLKDKMMQYGKNIALQGEIIGEGIQKNKYGIKGHKIVLFSAYDIDSHRHMNFAQLQEIATLFEMEIVPVIQTHAILPDSVDALVNMAHGNSQLLPSILREGIVIRSMQEQYDADLYGRLSFKVIDPLFLLKHGE